MSQEINESLNRLLEVDVVFPERVVAVDQDELAARGYCHSTRIPGRRDRHTLSGTIGLVGWYEGIANDPWKADHWAMQRSSNAREPAISTPMKHLSSSTNSW